DFPYAAGLVFEGSAHTEMLIDVVAGALRRFVAGMRLAEEQTSIPRARIVAGRVARVLAGAVTLEGMARASVELGEQITHRAVAPLLEDLSPLLTDLGPRIAAAQAVHDAERRAVVDPLTGLRNRREFERTLATAGRGSESASLIYIDLDHFKKLNDTLGHPAGDAALKHVARLLEAAVRDGDLVARIGGEEFAVWLPRTPLREGMEVAERIRRSVAERPLRWSGSV